MVPTNWVAKVRLVGDRVTGVTPAPVRPAVCGLLLALSLIVKFPEYVLVAVGVKVTLTAQLDDAPSDVPQLLVWL